MSWQDVLGHDAQIDRFRRNLANGRLASTFLFVGPTGIGKHLFALKLTQALFCEVNPEVACDPCGTCPSCQQVMSDTHPDLHTVGLLPNKNLLVVPQFTGGIEPGINQEFRGACYEINLKPVAARRKVLIIDDADYFHPNATSKLLKTLEEPPANAVIILIGTSSSQQKDTILSRCQIVPFNPLSVENIQQILVQQELVEDTQQALELAMISNGSVGFARQILEQDLLEVRREFLRILPGLPNHPEKICSLVNEFVKRASTRSEKGDQLDFLASIVIDCFHQVLLILSNRQSVSDQAMRDASQQILENWPGDSETVIACIDRTADLKSHLLRFANITTVTEAWVDDLSQIWLSAGFKLPTP
ncbi:MAG: ATP-binding protein [Pirellulaceae bacterium]